MFQKRRFTFASITIALFAGTAACTLILDRDKTQCSTNADCAHFAAGAVCVSNVCQSSEVADATTASDQNAPETATVIPTTEAGVDASFGIPGCFAGTPTSNDEFANACSHADCVPFDNCARLGECNGVGLDASAPEAGSAPAAAAPDSGATALCSSMLASGRSPVYVTGSSNFPPFLSTFAPVLAKSNYNVIWQVSNSCSGVDSVYNDVATSAAFPTSKQQIKETAGKTTLFFADDGTQVPCVLDTPATIDVGESDIYNTTCAATLKYDPSGFGQGTIGEYFGPILPMVFIVPGASSQTAFSSEAGLAVFGRGGAPDAAAPLPYTDPTQFFIRASSTATNQIMSRGIDIDPTHWWGIDKGTATNMSSQMAAVAPSLAEKTIGIISADFADNNAGNLKTLAFQAKNQSCAFYPDSTKNALDKINVRDGHYALWGPIHFFTKVSGGVPTTAAATAFVQRFSETKLEQDLLASIIKSHVIPSCAMNVTRDTEMGAIHAYDPPVHCGCFFDANAAGQANVVPSGCDVCATSDDCKNAAKPTCNYGFCEAR